MMTDETKEALRAFGNRRAQAMQEARLGAEARDLVRKAALEGATVTDISRLTGVSRPTVYALLADEQEDAAE